MKYDDKLRKSLSSVFVLLMAVGVFWLSYNYMFQDDEYFVLIEWHENGQKNFEYPYKNGKKEGLHTVWHANGQKAWEGTFRAGKEDGLRTVWNENGQKTWEGTFKAVSYTHLKLPTKAKV